MIQEIDLIASPREASKPEILKRKIADSLSVPISDISSYQLLKRSIDARSRNIKVNLRFRVGVNEVLPENIFSTQNYPDVSGSVPVLIVGAGRLGLRKSWRGIGR